MSVYLLTPLIEVVFCIALLVLLMTSGLRHAARKPFAFFLGFMGLWGFFILMMRSSANLEDAFFWEKFVLVAILSASVFFYRFTLTFTGTGERKMGLYTLYLFYITFLAMIPSGLVVGGMQTMWYGKAPVIGPLFFPYVSLVYAPIVLGLRMLIKHHKQSRILNERIRDSYVIAGIIMMFIGGTSDYLPSLGLNMYPLGIIGDIAFCLLATVAMLRYGLLEIKIVLRRGASYLISILMLGIFTSLIFVLDNLFEGLFRPIPLIVTALAVFAAAAVFQPGLSRLQYMVDKWFFRDRYDNLQALQRFTREMGGITDLKLLTSSLVTTIAHAMQSRSVHLLLPSSAAVGGFDTYAYYGEGGTGQLSLSTNSLLVLKMRYGDSIIDSNDADISKIVDSSDRRTLEINQTELLIPLRIKQRLVGVLLIGNKLSREPYSTEDRQLLRRVLGEVATSIENAYRFEGVQKKHEELKKITEGIIHAMSLTIETRDPYTAGHQRQVANLACEIAREMGLSEWDVEGIRIIGLLHDVGKVSVPAEILSKSGRISQYEFSIIKTHPEVGYEILKEIEFPWPITQAILQHHERLDGSGYPTGISGKDIIREARILGVADVVEAMSSHRPYRPALGFDSALEEISEKRGILYDPEVVDACFRLFQREEAKNYLINR